MKTTIVVNLPWDGQIIAHIKQANRMWIVTSRHHPYHPFVTHEVHPNGFCAHGGYHSRRSEAFKDMYERALRWSF